MAEEPNEKDIAAFQRWKAKHGPGAEKLLDQQTSLREFKEAYGVEKGSNFHCPWCYEGRLYYNETQDFYVCRRCELRFRITCLDLKDLDGKIETKKEERRQRREQKKAESALIRKTEEEEGTKAFLCGGCDGTGISPQTGLTCEACKGEGTLTLERIMEESEDDEEGED